MSGATLINPNQERNYFLNKPMSTVNQPSVGQASSAPLNFLASSSGGNFQDSQSRSHQNANSNSRREYGQKNNNNFVSHKNNNNYHANNGSYNNNGNVNTSSNERNSKQSYNNNNNNNNSYDNSFRSYNNQRDRKQSPYCRDRSSAEEVSEAPSKTKAIQKQYKTLKLSIKFDLTDNVRRQQQLRVNVNCFQNKFSKMNNTIIPTLPKFLLQNQQPQQTPSAMNNRPY